MKQETPGSLLTWCKTVRRFTVRNSRGVLPYRGAVQGCNQLQPGWPHMVKTPQLP